MQQLLTWSPSPLELLLWSCYKLAAALLPRSEGPAAGRGAAQPAFQRKAHRNGLCCDCDTKKSSQARWARLYKEAGMSSTVTAAPPGIAI